MCFVTQSIRFLENLFFLVLLNACSVGLFVGRKWKPETDWITNIEHSPQVTKIFSWLADLTAPVKAPGLVRGLNHWYLGGNLGGWAADDSLSVCCQVSLCCEIRFMTMERGWWERNPHRLSLAYLDFYSQHSFSSHPTLVGDLDRNVAYCCNRYCCCQLTSGQSRRMRNERKGNQKRITNTPLNQHAGLSSDRLWLLKDGP